MDNEVAGRRYQVSFAVLAVGVAAFATLISLVTPVLPTIQRSLHTSQDTVTWLMTAYLLSASVFTPICGRIGDVVGKKRMFVLTLVALGLGSLLAAVGTSIGVLIVARAIQGIGGGVMPLAFGLIRDLFPPERVRSAIAMMAGLVAAGGGLGVVLAGPIVDALNYHWLFWIPLVVVALAAVAAHLVVPESPVRHAGAISVSGALLMSTWLVTLLLAVSEGSVWGWLSAPVVVLLVATIAAFAAWYVVESRSRSPLIDIGMMRLPAVWTTNLVTLLFGMGMYASMAFLPAFVQTPSSFGYGFGASTTQSGFFLLPLTVVMFICGALTGPLANRIGSKLVLLAGAALSVVGYAILAFAHSHPWEIYVASAVIGSALGFAYSAMSNLVVEAVPPSQTGVATGMNANVRTIGGSLGSAVMASIVTSTLHRGLPQASGYTVGFAVLAATSVAATLAAVLIPASRRLTAAAAASPAIPATVATAGRLVAVERE